MFLFNPSVFSDEDTLPANTAMAFVDNSMSHQVFEV
jgi:hypothetical protein